MRVLLTTDVAGGVWRHTVELVRALTGLGCRCAVAVAGESDADREESLPASVEVVRRDLRLPWMPGGIHDVEAARSWVAEFARAWGADVVHLNEPSWAPPGPGMPVLAAVHSDVLSWFREVRGQPAPPSWREYRQAMREGLRAAAVVVAPSHYQARHTSRHYGVLGVRVVHNGQRPPDGTGDSRRASRRPRILVVGRAWDEGKGVRLLEQALELLGDDAPEVDLVGPLDGPAGERMRPRRLTAHGRVPGPAVARFHAESRLYVAPSLYEPFGLAPLEAAGHGAALLLAGIGSFRELWSGAAAFFWPLRPDRLARRLAGLLADPGALDDLGGRAWARARIRYTGRRMAEGYAALYQEIASAAPAPARRSRTLALPAS